jgi:hypothetical protein
MHWLKQSTAWTARVGPVLDSAGAEYSGLVIGDLSLTKNGTTAAMAAAATLTYDANGYYTLSATTGNSDTLGRMMITVNKAGYQMPPKEYMVLPATTYDALVTNEADAAGGLCDTKRVAGTLTTGLLVSTGVFSTAALANAPSGGGEGDCPTVAEIVAGLAGTGITVTSPVITTNSSTGLPVSIEIVQGMDYSNTDGTALTLTMTGMSSYPDWTSGTVYLDIDCGTTLSKAGTITTATGTTRVVRFDLTAAETAALTDTNETRNEIIADTGYFDVRVVLSGSSRVNKPISKAQFIARRPA